MAQAVRLLASMQLPSETLQRILAPAERRTADVLFYTGCNVLRTPHIVLNVMDILDALELDFDVVGGTAALLRRLPVPGGRPADLRADGPSHLPALRPVRRLQGADLVPDLHQELRRAREGVEPAAFDLGHISEFLAANLDALQARFSRPAAAPRGDPRASRHRRDASSSVRTLLKAVPNLELVELPQDPGFSYACGGHGG